MSDDLIEELEQVAAFEAWFYSSPDNASFHLFTGEYAQALAKWKEDRELRNTA